MSAFDALLADLDATLDAAFGEEITIQGITASDYAVAPDPARPATVVRAIVAAAARDDRVSTGGRATTDTAHGYAATEALLAPPALEALGWEPRSGDRVTLEDGAGYRVTSPTPEEGGGLRLTLTRARPDGGAGA